MGRSFKVILFALLINVSINAQHMVYFTQWESVADRDIIIVKSPLQADVCINIVDSRLKLDRYENAWYVTKWRSQADYIFRKVSTTNGNRNALRVYFYDPPKRNLQHRWIRKYNQLFDGQ